MSLEFDIACLRAPCEPGDTMGVVQLIARAKMAADQLEELTAQRDELLAALKWVKECKYEPDKIICTVDHVVFKVEHNA